MLLKYINKVKCKVDSFNKINEMIIKTYSSK